MAVRHGQEPISAERREGGHLVLFDGVCGLCSRLVQFVLQHDRKAVFDFAPLQSETAKTLVTRFGGNADELTSFFVVVDYRSEHARLLNRSTAALFVARKLGWPWKVAVVARVLPVSIRDRLYDAVARRRYQVFGRLDRCVLPQPRFRRRFIDC